MGGGAEEGTVCVWCEVCVCVWGGEGCVCVCEECVCGGCTQFDTMLYAKYLLVVSLLHLANRISD